LISWGGISVDNFDLNFSNGFYDTYAWINGGFTSRRESIKKYNRNSTICFITSRFLLKL